MRGIMDLRESLDLVERLVGFSLDPTFLSYERATADDVASALASRWKSPGRQSYEPSLVEAITAGFASQSGFSGNQSTRGMGMKTSVAFIHGPDAITTPAGRLRVPGSQVRFRMYDDPAAQRELGDLLLVASVIFRGKKEFERCSFVQFKRSRKEFDLATWNLDASQQYLLTRFPVFSGFGHSLVPPGPHAVANTSGALGSFAFLFSPGDFAFLGGRRCTAFFGDEAHVSSDGLRSISRMDAERRECGLPPRRDGSFTDLPPWHLTRLLDGWPYGPTGGTIRPILSGNMTYADNIHEVVRGFLTLNLGEPTRHPWLPEDRGTRGLLMGLFENAERIGRERGLPDLKNVGTRFLSHPYSNDDNRGLDSEPNADSIYPHRQISEPSDDNDGRGYGIVYAELDLGE
jgi:hypothetical protein